MNALTKEVISLRLEKIAMEINEERGRINDLIIMMFDEEDIIKYVENLGKRIPTHYQYMIMRIIVLLED